jgi:hypothetical protein
MTGAVPANETDVVFSRRQAGAQSEPTATAELPRLANQSSAKVLNATLVRYGLGAEWSNAYAAVKLPDALSGIRQAVQTAFGRDIRAVVPTAEKFNIFNGTYVSSEPGAVYVNASGNIDFITIVGHELWHTIERQRPDLIDWYQQHSHQFYKDLPAYRNRLNALLQGGEKPYSSEKAEEVMVERPCQLF